MLSQLRNYQHECDQLREQIDTEAEGKAELQRLISKANAEAQQWRAKYESEGLNKSEEAEETRRKMQARVQELQEQLDQTVARVATVDKVRQRLQSELEDAQVDADRANQYAQQLEKKQKSFDKVIDEWKRKCDDLHIELESSQREARNLSTEVNSDPLFKSKFIFLPIDLLKKIRVFKLKNFYDKINEYFFSNSFV